MNNQNNRNTGSTTNRDPLDEFDNDEPPPFGAPAQGGIQTQAAGTQLWGDFDDEAADAYAEQMAKDRGAGKFLKIEAGKKVIVRFLPPRPGERTPFRTVWEHNIELPGSKTNFACPRMNAKLPCPACTAESQYRAQGQEDTAKGFKAKKRLYANVIVRGEEDKGVRILGFGTQIEEQIMDIRREAGVNFSHPVSGVDFIIKREGSGQFDTQYKVLADPKGPSPLATNNDVMMELATTAHDLTELSPILSAEEIMSKLRGGDKRGGGNQGGGRQLGGGNNAASALRGGR